MNIKKILIAPDSFKGTMSSLEVCGIIREQFFLQAPEVEVVSLPIADGGEGTADCFLMIREGKRVPVKVSGPLFEELDAWYALINDGKTAIVELAVCAGLPLVENRKDPSLTTTYGVGQLVLHAAKSGAEEILVAIGGSCTNDGGCGCAAALGVKFFDKDGKLFVPTGGTLSDVERIDLSGIDPAMGDIVIKVICDVDNPFYGKNGAAYIFAPQKGADEKMVGLLDDGLKHLSEKIETYTGKDIADMPGAGAAGGIGGGLAAFFGFPLESGIKAALDIAGFEELASGCDLILTGEGRIDSQSAHGKVIDGVAARAKRLGIPVIAIAGDIGDGYKELYEKGVSAVLSTNRAAIPFKQARLRAKSDLADTIDGLIRILKL